MAEPEKASQPAQEPAKTDPASTAPALNAAKSDQSDKSELPQVESPPLSPAGSVDEPEKIPEPETVISLAAAASSAPAASATRTFLTRRLKRNGMLAASVMLAAAAGAVIGALAIPQAPPPPTRVDTASTEERASMQRSIAHLSKEISTLKAGIEAASKGTGAQIGKIGDRLERIEKSDRNTDTTGSIAKAATPAAALPAVAAVRADAPLPPPRPNVVVAGWTVREAGNGRAVIENRGEYYDVRPGDPLPGLGTIEAIKRDNGRWVVVTAKGVIAALPPAATAQTAVRRRSYYSPYYWPY